MQMVARDDETFRWARVTTCIEPTKSQKRVGVFFGLGPNTIEAGRSFYGMRQTILGVSGVKPFAAKLSAAVFGEVNGRFVDIRPSLGQQSPCIGALYTEATAPDSRSRPALCNLARESACVRCCWMIVFTRITT